MFFCGRILSMSKLIFKVFLLLPIAIIGFSVFFPKPVFAADTDISFGNKYVFNSASSTLFSVGKLSENKFVVAFQDGAESGNVGRIVIGNAADKEISFGESYVFNNNNTNYISLSVLSENKFVVGYKDKGALNYGKVRIGEISGDNVSFGDAQTFNSSISNHISLAALSPDKFVLAYQRGETGENNSEVIIGTVNGTELSMGQKYAFNSGLAEYISVISLLPTKFIVGYQDKTNSRLGTLIIGELNGDDISFGGEYIFNSAETAYISLSKLSENRFIAAYKDKGGSLNYGRAIVGEVDGKTASFGDEYDLNYTSTNFISVDSFDENKAVFTYQSNGNLDYGQALIGQINGKSLSFGNEYDFNSVATGDTFVRTLSQGRFIVVFQDRIDSLNHATAIVGSVPFVQPEPQPQPEPEPASESPAPAETPSETPSISLLNDGDLIRNSNAQGEAKFDVYIVKIVGDKKFKRLILSPFVFESYKHLNWDNIKEVNQATLDAYTTSSLVRSDNSDKVYNLTPNGDNGIKQWLNMTASEFLNQYDSDSIYQVNSFELEAYENGTDIGA